MTDNHWGGILQSRNSKDIAEEFRKKLAAKIELDNSCETLNMLHDLRKELLKEISVGKRIPEEMEKLIAKLPNILFADELQNFRVRFLQLAAELYTTRSSVSSTFSHAQSFYDRLVTTAFKYAVTLLKNEGLEFAGLTYALLVSGELGRAESVLGSRSSFFFIYRETAAIDHDTINELAIHFMAALSTCFPDINRNLHNPTAYWFGSDADWHKTAANLLRVDESDNWDKSGGGSFTLFIETAADMRTVGGDSDYGRSITASNRSLLAEALQSDSFWHLAKDTATMPVALGVFGRFKTVRNGINRGKIDLQTMAIDPLAAATRLLALSCGVGETSFSGRIKSILAAGNMGVALADRLLIAYQNFMHERIRLELSDDRAAAGLFFNPESLSEEAKERFKAGLEDIITLQRLVHQQLAEVKPG